MPEGTSDSKIHYFILDPSALAYGGIGKIKKWTTEQNVVFFIPNYTLRELDFLKKNYNSLISMNSRESIRFIDQSMNDSDSDLDDGFGINSSPRSVDDEASLNISDDDSLNEFDDFDDFESFNKKKQEMSLQQQDGEGKTSSTGSSYSKKYNNSDRKFKSHFILEGLDEAGPDWRRASGYRRRTPMKTEFPIRNNNGFGFLGTSNINVSEKATYREDELVNLTGGLHLDKDSVDESHKAVISKRLKFLVRSCLQKAFVENKDREEHNKISWKIICEDQSTMIWLKCFGLEVTTLNEVDALFGGKLHEPNVYEPVSHYTVLPTGSRGSSKKKNSRKPKKKIIKAQEARIDQDGITRERYDTITFAPRGKGELWQA